MAVAVKVAKMAVIVVAGFLLSVLVMNLTVGPPTALLNRSVGSTASVNWP